MDVDVAQSGIVRFIGVRLIKMDRKRKVINIVKLLECSSVATLKILQRQDGMLGSFV